jgi:hypothetical protein
VRDERFHKNSDYLLKHLWTSSFVNYNTWHLICNNLNLNFIYGIVCLYVCVYAFSFHRESPNMIWGDKPLIFEVVMSQSPDGFHPSPPFQTLLKPQHRISSRSPHITTDGRPTLSTLNTSQTQHHKDGKTCTTTQAARLSITTNHKNLILKLEGLGNQLMHVASVY